MNLINILEEHGYEIVNEIDMKYFRLKLTKKELEKRKASKAEYGYNLESVFNVAIAGVGFKGDGGLYIVLECIGGQDQYFEVGDCFDVIEY